MQAYYPNVDMQKELGTTQGIYVDQITPGGGAQAAGLQRGDTITKFNGQEVSSMNSLNNKLIHYRPGDKVKLTILREKKSMEVEVTLKSGSET